MAQWQRFYLGYQGRFSDDVLLTLPNCSISVSQAPSASSQAKGKVKESKVKDPSLTGRHNFMLLCEADCADMNAIEAERLTLSFPQEQRSGTAPFALP
jgi:hypothetical protein